MNTTEFLEAILPHEGVVLIAVKSDRGFLHYGYSSFASAASAVVMLSKQGKEAYHACAAYKSVPYKNEAGDFIARKSENWLSAKAFWADIDCGKDKAEKREGYATQEEGARAIVTWCRNNSVPTPMLVNSGRGIHAYWLLSEAISPEQWRPAAAAFKSWMQKDGLLVDPSRTADFSSILRPVGTFNNKDPQAPREVKLVWKPEENIDVEPFLALLNSHSDKPVVEEAPDYMRAYADKCEEQKFGDAKYSAYECAKHCKQLQIINETGGNANYKTWYAAIGLCTFCEEGLEAAKAWTLHRAETEHDSTDYEYKFKTWRSKPPTCAAFRDACKEPCEGCKYKGVSPLHLGRIAPTAEPEVVTGVLEKAEERGEVSVEVPAFPEGYYWNETSHALCKVVPVQDDKPKHIPFCGIKLYLRERLSDANGEIYFVCRAHLPKGTFRDFNITGRQIGGNASGLLEKLGSQEIFLLPTKNAGAHMQAYLSACVKDLMSTKEVKATYNHFGWQEDGTFLIGDRRYSPDGAVTEVLLGRAAGQRKADFPSPKGSLDGYSKAINWVYNRPGMEPMQYFMASLWGAPLVDLYDPTYCGIPCALTGMSSGKGKTTAGQMAIYAYGLADTSHGLIVAGDLGATSKYQAKQLGVLKNLPMLFDEVTNKNPKQLSSLCYDLSNGVEMGRLRPTGGDVSFADRESWRTQVGMTGNADISAKLGLNGGSEAEAMRIFEVRVDYYDIPVLDPVAVSMQVAEAAKNTGCAGEVFIKYVVTHKDDVRTQLINTSDSFKSQDYLMSEPKYRFYRNHMVCTLTAAKIMKQLGVIDFDIQALTKFAMRAVNVAFKRAEENNSMSDTIDVLGSMLLDLTPRIITTPTLDVAKNAEPYRVTCPQGIVGRLIRGNASKCDEYDSKLYIAVSAIKAWAIDHRVDKAILAKEWKSKGVLLQTSVRICLGKGTIAPTPQIRCWEFDHKKLEELGVNEEIGNDSD